MRTELEILNRLCFNDKMIKIIEKHLLWYTQKIIVLSCYPYSIKCRKKIVKFQKKIEQLKLNYAGLYVGRDELAWCICSTMQSNKHKK